MIVNTRQVGKKITFKTEDGRELFTFDMNKYNYKKISNAKLKQFAMWLLDNVKVR